MEITAEDHKNIRQKMGEKEIACILHARSLHLTVGQALQYMKKNGYEMSGPTWTSKKNAVKEIVDERARTVIENGVIEHHLTLISELRKRKARLEEIEKNIDEDDPKQKLTHLKVLQALTEMDKDIAIALDDVSFLYEQIEESKHNLRQYAVDAQRAANIEDKKHHDADIEARRAEFLKAKEQWPDRNQKYAQKKEKKG